MKEAMALFKFRGDYAVIYAFQEKLQQFYKQHYNKQDLLIVPIPLSNERLHERGFNQAEAIASLLPKLNLLESIAQLLPLKHFFFQQPFRIENILTRTHHEKQSKKSRTDRIHAKNVFSTNTQKINKPILLIDDIYTTGSTLRHAAKVLKEAGATSVSALTLIRG
nr:phosphoribosyltransferase family protein [Bacillus sp. HMF5848]